LTNHLFTCKDDFARSVAVSQVELEWGLLTDKVALIPWFVVMTGMSGFHGDLPG
jgi:hypothetical protein